MGRQRRAIRESAHWVGSGRARNAPDPSTARPQARIPEVKAEKPQENQRERPRTPNAGQQKRNPSARLLFPPLTSLGAPARLSSRARSPAGASPAPSNSGTAFVISRAQTVALFPRDLVTEGSSATFMHLEFTLRLFSFWCRVIWFCW